MNKMKDYVVIYELKGKREIAYITAQNPQDVVNKFYATYLYENFTKIYKSHIAINDCNILTVAEVVGGWENKYKEI